MKGGLAKEQVEEGGVVGLDDEEEDFFCRYLEERGANDCVWRIGPYSSMDQVRVPWCCRDNGNLQMVSAI